MAASARDLVQDALEMLMVYAAGEAMSDADAERGLTVLNDMLDSWSNEQLTMYQLIEQSTPLIAGKQTYSIGAGGDVNVTRPLRIETGPGAAYVQDVNGNNYDLAVVARDAWNMIGNRSNLVNSNVPDTLFYDPAFPLGLLNFAPVPNIAGYTAFWDSDLQLTDFASLAGTLSLPPGYALAIKSNLAIDLKPYFLKGQLDPAIIRKAAESKANIKRTNQKMSIARMDGAIVAQPGGSYNIYSDQEGG